MDGTFTRALLGFVLLTAAISSMAWIALWGIEVFGGGAWWASLMVVLIALVAEISVYGSTLHGPIYDWIKEPARRVAREEDARREAARDAARELSRARPT